jgi:hypothetical protein
MCSKNLPSSVHQNRDKKPSRHGRFFGLNTLIYSKFESMKALLDIKDSRASFFLELLKEFSYVKAKPLTETNNLFLNELKDAVEEVKKIKAGKIKGRPAQ